MNRSDLTVVDPNNLTRILVALERWAVTGELLAQAVEKTGSTANTQALREAQTLISELRKLIAQLRG